MSNSNNVIAFNGPLTMNFISFTANYIRDAINTNHGVSKRIFKVFIELVQNVSYYSAETRKSMKDPDTRRGVGSFSIDEFDDHFQISTKNLVLKEHAPILQKNCDEINRLNEEELRELKRKTRSKASIKDVGAHIGLIHTGIISSSPLEVGFEGVDEIHDNFIIKVRISKAINT